jgi:hypothetical protein
MKVILPPLSKTLAVQPVQLDPRVIRYGGRQPSATLAAFSHEPDESALLMPDATGPGNDRLLVMQALSALPLSQRA